MWTPFVETSCRLASLEYDLQRYDLARNYAQEAITLAPSNGSPCVTDSPMTRGWCALSCTSSCRPSSAPYGDAVNEVGRSVGHPAPTARGAEPASLAGECHDPVLAACIAVYTKEAVGQDTALQK